MIILMLSFEIATARELSFIPYLDNHQVEIGKMIVIDDDTLSITSFKFYISSHQSSSSNLCMLLNMEETLACSIPDDIETLSFGLDSIDNVQTSFEGALDPIHGMFWTWNAGYVNCKIEGKSNRSPQVHQSFTIHLGGYRIPYATFFTFSVPNNQQRTIFAINLLPVIKLVLNKHEGNIMSVGTAAVECSRLLMQSMSEYK